MSITQSTARKPTTGAYGGVFTMVITKAEIADLEQILALQYLAYQSEAIIYNDFSIPPLTQTIAEIRQEYENCVFLKAVDDEGNIIGSVRALVDDDTAYIGKLIVHPNVQGQGIGTRLMSAIERESGAARFELFTGDKSTKNLRLYEHLGYLRFKEETVGDDLVFVYLERYAGNRR